MILTDTAPLIALIDKGQQQHKRCVEAYNTLNQPMLTTWCCLTEAMYFLCQLRGWNAQNILWEFVQRKALYLHHITDDERSRMQKLMKQYQDTPMDLADASLVATAESQNLHQIFTLDSDFLLYRLQGKNKFTIIPAMNQ